MVPSSCQGRGGRGWCTLPRVVVRTSLEPTEVSHTRHRRHPVCVAVGNVPWHFRAGSMLPPPAFHHHLQGHVPLLLPHGLRGIARPPSGPRSWCPVQSGARVAFSRQTSDPDGTLPWISCEARMMPCPGRGLQVPNQESHVSLFSMVCPPLSLPQGSSPHFLR